MPQMVGGSQRTADALIRALAARGHQVVLAAGLVGSGWLGWRGRVLMKLRRRRAVADRLLGYETRRSWHSWQALPEIVADFAPDVALVLAHGPVPNALALQDLGVPFLMAFQDVEFHELGGDLGQVRGLRGVANSRFTANRYADAFGASATVIHPLIEADRYRTTGGGGHVTFVNPDPVKGLDVALGLAAARPDIPFLIVEGWPLNDMARASLMERLAPLANVTLRASAADMRDIYAVTRVLLAPSQWEEGYGRVASEAQISGIPVLGSDRGGLPEAIGAGGIIVPHDAPVDRWAAALDELWDDADAYHRASAAAREHAGRDALNIERQIDAWEAALQDAARRG